MQQPSPASRGTTIAGLVVVAVLLVAVVVLVFASGRGQQAESTRTAVPEKPATPVTQPPAVPSQPHPRPHAPVRRSLVDAAAPRAQEAAQAFAEAYVAYLDGRRAAAALPYSTLTSRQQAVEGGEIPAGLRTHPARVQAVEPEGSTSVTAQYVVAVAAGRRSYPFKMRLAWGSDGWRVTGLQPPDMTQANATPAPAPPGPSTALRAAAREFALAYVNYTSGVRRTPPEGEPVLLRQIEAGGDPLVGAKVPRVPATLAGVLYGPVQSGRIAAEATVRAGGQTYTFSFVMQSTGQGWRASGFPTGQSG